MVGMSKDDKISKIIGAVEVFVNSIAEIAAVFLGDYDEGDFCSGLIFGKDGAIMML